LNNTIFLPKTIKVGYQNRSDTYTGQLAYVIYYDQQNKLRKERSWEGWRDNKIEPQEFSNEPTSGFVLNKKVGGYDTGWNHRQTYTRVYDPRGFEFEITIPNLLYILENANSIKGKGLEGDFIYGWSDKDIILIPVESPDYLALSNLNKLRHEHVKFDGKTLIAGATYKTDQNESLIYLGRFYESNGDKKETKTYFFYDIKSSYRQIRTIKSLTNSIIEVIDENCVEDYSNLMDELLKSDLYSEREQKKDKYIDYTYEEFKTAVEKDGYWGRVFTMEDNDGNSVRYIVKKYRNYSYYSSRYNDLYDVFTTSRGYEDENILKETSILNIYNKFKPKYLVTYNSKNKLIKEWK